MDHGANRGAVGEARRGAADAVGSVGAGEARRRERTDHLERRRDGVADHDVGSRVGTVVGDVEDPVELVARRCRRLRD